ncbi:glycosyltransferase [Ottowia thiooxydans]|uniref:Glycosyltransferase involved in cell wall biosynthesis n=1 Tax=Ottowia thiooxydans TaxID=219182 RepID=A0ABV2Q2J6_9BURK
MTRSLHGRVLHVGKFFPPHRGGMESFLADLITEQRQQGLYAIGLVHGLPRHDDPSWLHRVRVQTEVLYAPMGMGFPFKLRRLIREFEPDVIHLHMPNNAAFWALIMRSARRIPWVVHWQSDVVPSRVRRALSAAYMLYEPFERAILAQAYRVIATSPPYLAASPTLQPWLDKCCIVPLGLADQSLDSPAPRTSLSKQALWRPGAFRLLSIGRLVYYKGFETLIQAVSSIPGVQLLIAGEGEMRPALEALIKSFEAETGQESPVQLLGSVSEAVKHELFETCDVFCLASCERTESFGLVLIEAMQHAKPCIVSDLPGSGMPWVVKEAGAGVDVPLDDLGAWRTAIHQFRGSPDLRQQMGESGKRAAAGRFSIATCAWNIARLYASASPEIGLADQDNDSLIILHTEGENPLAQTYIDALRLAGWQDILVVGDQAQRRHLDGALPLPSVLSMGAWNSIQTGLRYALQHGYKRVFTVDINRFPQVKSLEDLQNAMDQPSGPDVVIGAFPKVSGKHRDWAWKWLKTLTGISLQDPSSGFRLYNHDAMVVSASREATLLDHEDIGSLLLFRKSRLRVSEVAVAPLSELAQPVSPKDSFASTLHYLAATTVLCCSNWSNRAKRR